MTLDAIDVVDGRYHAWVERDSACATCQSKLTRADTVRSTTTGTICNGLRTIAVGAYDGTTPRKALARFSSAGPTRDGRVKPDLIAPGVDIGAARSIPRAGGAPQLTTKSGTSMAAPRVTGTIACMFQAAGRPLSIDTTRNLLLGAADPVSFTGIDASRAGSGYLNTTRAIEAASLHGPTHEEETMNDEMECTGCGNRGGEASCAECASREESLGEDTPPKKILVLLSGGPGLFDDRDLEHDKSWANYVTPPLLLHQRKALVEKGEDVVWYVYKPAYEQRWTDDSASTRRAQKDAVKEVKDKKFTSYVDLIEGRAKKNGWKLVWISDGNDFYLELTRLPKRSITRVWFWVTPATTCGCLSVTPARPWLRRPILARSWWSRISTARSPSDSPPEAIHGAVDSWDATRRHSRRRSRSTSTCGPKA